MASKLSVHWQRIHPDDARDWTIFERWRPKSIKIITSDETVHGIGVIPHDTLTVVRSHPLSENWSSDNDNRRDFRYETPEQMGQGHAAFCKRLTDWIRINDPARDMDRVVFTGLNEPHLDGGEPPEMTARYSVALAKGLHGFGLHAGLLSLSVGWPGNGGITDAPPIWKPFDSVADAWRPGDYLFLHEYSGKNGPQVGWRWLMGRYLQCPYDLPIIIGECGIDQYAVDGSVQKEQRGWRAWLSPRQYVEQLKWYDARLREDKRIHSAQIYGYDWAHPWASFNIRENDFMDIFLPFVESQHGTPDDDWQPTPTPGLPGWLKDVVDTLPHHPVLKYPKRTQSVTAIAVHHTATPPDTTVETIARYHVQADPARNKEEWAGIGYHVVIAADGATYLTQHLDILSNHVYDHNAEAVGLSFIGNFTEAPPTDAQMTAGKRALAWLLKELKLKPEDVRGHKDFPNQTTACPGNLPREQWWKELLTMLDENKARNAAWNAAGIALNPDSAFYKEARQRALGRPVTAEIDVDGYRLQGYDRGILAARLFIENGVVVGGDWGHMQVVEWLA